MKFTIPLITTLLSLLPALVSGQDACRNCKADVDDSDPRIVYSPAASWGHETTSFTELYYLGTVSSSRAAGAQATFKFTGVVGPLCSAYRSIAVSHAPLSRASNTGLLSQLITL
jgi:hypothetical protein